MSLSVNTAVRTSGRVVGSLSRFGDSEFWSSDCHRLTPPTALPPVPPLQWSGGSCSGELLAPSGAFCFDRAGRAPTYTRYLKVGKVVGTVG
ncbi:hypothetical protein BR93DRAFT_928967, partial [Coniochaeta sp. PMI_546]